MKIRIIICTIIAIGWLILYHYTGNENYLILSGVWGVGSLIISGQNES